ncbi:MAPK/MAK/MRK overlapping kinase isoform X4 [Tamandua tetradactyla]
MSFDFPFKKGSGISFLTTSLSPHCLSLLCAMVAYDPDERITAHQALQHPFFQEQRAAEKQALASCRKSFSPGHPMALASVSTGWHVSKEGRKQNRFLKQEEDHSRRQGHAYLMELPKLKISGVSKLSSHSSPALQAVFGAGMNGKIPLLQPLKCVNKKTDTTKDIKSHLKQYHLPTIERKGRGY